MTDSTVPRASRRAVIAAAIAGVAPLPAAARQGDATPANAVATRVAAPAWVFELHAVRDPYAGAMQVPAAVPAGSRAVAIDVEIGNDADQALDFTPLDVRLRDAAGVEYRGGAAIGTEPTINPRNLNPGERSRGWVWYLLPETAELVEVVYVAPPPQLRVSLTGGAG
jgi:hypothetical protein